MFTPTKIFYERGIESTPLGQMLLNKYRDIEKFEIENHNKIPELRALPDTDFTKMKKYLIIGTRKTLRLIPNSNSADYIVPFTSSGCTALCLYCYLVCVYFNGSYLRLFVNRDGMLNQIKKTAAKHDGSVRFELGSNSDMLLENTITGNLNWIIEEFAHIPNGICTFSTKFSYVDSLLTLNHQGHTEMRVSLNPAEYISKIELGTHTLLERIEAANKMSDAGYPVGINVAPIILLDGWEDQYLALFTTMKEKLCKEIQTSGFFELIFMTYGLTNHAINRAALPNAVDIFDQSIMRPRGRGKYCYTPLVREAATPFFTHHLSKMFPNMRIKYIV